MVRRFVSVLIRFAVIAAAVITLCGGTDLFARPLSAVIATPKHEVRAFDLLAQRPYLPKAIRIRSAKPRTEVASLLADTLRSAAAAATRPAIYAGPSSSPFALHCSAGALLS